MAAESDSANSLLKALHAERNRRLQTGAEPTLSTAEAGTASAAAQLPAASQHSASDVGESSFHDDDADRITNESITSQSKHLSPASRVETSDCTPAASSGGNNAPGLAAARNPSSSLGPAGLDLSKVEEELNCPLCMAMFCEPVTLQCGHSFCRGCLSRGAAQLATGGQCPMCRAPMLLDVADMHTSYTLCSILHTLFPAEAASRAAEGRAEQQEASTRVLPVFYLDTPYMPRQKVHLLVFELRYLELVNRAMAGGRSFCVFNGGDLRAAQGVGGEPAIGAAVRIENTEQLPGGRLQLVGTVTSLLESASTPQLVPGGSGLELLAVQDRSDVATTEDTFNATLRPLHSAATGQAARDTLAHVASTQLTQEYRDALYSCASDLIAQLGPVNASAMAAAYGTLPTTAVQLSHYLTAVLDLHPNVVARCRRTRSTLQRLAEVYAFLAEHAQREASPPQEGVHGNVPPLGHVSAPAVLRFCRGGDAWLRSMGQAIAKPTPVQGVVVLIAVLLLLYFNSNA